MPDGAAVMWAEGQRGAPLARVDGVHAARARGDGVCGGLFLAAVRHGDLQGLLDVLAPDVVIVADGGGLVAAARRPIEGAERVAAFLIRAVDTVRFEVAPVWLNGSPAARIDIEGELDTAVSLTVEDGPDHPHLRRPQPAQAGQPHRHGDAHAQLSAATAVGTSWHARVRFLDDAVGSAAGTTSTGAPEAISGGLRRPAPAPGSPRRPHGPCRRPWQGCRGAHQGRP